ncbi:biotin--[acetyl-CoA-carboxylase] ligase [Micromonospora sp. DT81.3]|uniref:biotin--[acetyl-CoA-carboxylase] ligase n=1 Tax=Micromonospora sp. DT81.3 TaxID=3416523 RepID=UPI003CF86A84
MPIPDDGYPRAAAVSPRLQVASRTASTNADLVSAVSEGAAQEWPHLSVLLTTDQTAGRGRLDRSWTTPPGTALAVSVLVRVPGIPLAARGWIPLLAGAAMTRAIDARMRGTGHTARLKWPNDVLVDGLKICGILAEVTTDPDAIVVGAGVNTTMTRSDLPVTTATSFTTLGVEPDDDAMLADYLRALDEQLAALAAAHGDAAAAGVHGEVEALCSTVGREVIVALPDGSELAGVAEMIDKDGRLVVAGRAVSAGDVVHVR